MKLISQKILKGIGFSLVLSYLVLMINTQSYAAQMHNVTFKYGTTSVDVQVAHGKNATPPSNIQIPGYTFIGWVGNYQNVTEDRIILGSYAQNLIDASNISALSDECLKKYNYNTSANFPNIPNLQKGEPGKTCAIHWYNGATGGLIKTEIVNYGTSSRDIPDPRINGYNFLGWEGSWENVTEDRAIQAHYEKVYTVKFIDGLTGGTFNTQKINEGKNAEVPSAPYHEGYQFSYYTDSANNIKSDRNITAIYEKEFYWLY